MAEVQRLGKTFDEFEAEGTNPKALNIMRLWVLTVCRRNEIAALKWSEIDFEHGCLQLAQTKTGKSTRPLGVAAIAVLQKITREDDSEHVSPAESGGDFFQDYKTPWKRAIEKAGLPGVSPHTLRHTMGSTTVSAGEALAFAGAILGMPISDRQRSMPMSSMNRRGRSQIGSAQESRPHLPEQRSNPLRNLTPPAKTSCY